MKKTAGIFLFSSDGLLLIGKPTGNKIWTIPKGLGDVEDKSIKCTAIREFREETGILLSEYVLVELPKVEYLNKDKCLYPFVFKSFLNHYEYRMFCESCIDNTDIPEIEEFKWVTPNDAFNYLHYTQVQTLQYILTNNL